MLNVEGHRIEYGALALQGVVVGLISSVVLGVVASLLGPIITTGHDVSSFLKIVATPLMGEAAVTPVTGFDPGAVLVGAGVLLALGAIMGAGFAMVVGFFDLEGFTQVAVVGLLLGAVYFVITTVIIGLGLVHSAFEQLELAVMFWGHVAFGLTAGALMARSVSRHDRQGGTDEHAVDIRVPVEQR